MIDNASLPQHESAPASAAARGREFGAAHAERVANTLACYRELFAAARGLTPGQIEVLGERVSSDLHRNWPRLATEISGIAAGAGASASELFAANARTEILAGATPPECSVIGVLPGRSARGSLLLAQNWDWHPGLAASLVLWTIHRPGGRWLTTLTEAGLVAKIGLNSSGVGVMLNILTSSRDGGVGGLPVHALLRLLHECDDMRSALLLIRQAKVTASSCITIGCAGRGAAEAGLVSAELSPGGHALIWPEDGVLLHTNHFRSGPPAGQDLYVRDWPDTVTRLASLRDDVEGSGAVSAAQLQAALRSHQDGPLSVCCHGEDAGQFADKAATLASVILDLDRPEMLVAAGQPCTGDYLPVRVLAGAAAE
jgi:isopenicillin-N N-acyltransferase like protein